MGDIKFVNLTVEDIKENNGRVSIKANGEYFSFFQTKRNGELSRAQLDFQKLGVVVGGTYSFGITENIKKNDDGSNVIFKNICLIGALKNDNENKE